MCEVMIKVAPVLSAEGDLYMSEAALIDALKGFNYHVLHNAHVEDFDEEGKVKKDGHWCCEIRADKVLVKADITIAEES